MPSAGDVVAGHRIESILARGGMGVVFVAEHIHLGHKRALKVIAAELTSDEGFRRRFIRESRLAASLEHPNIVPIHYAGESEVFFTSPCATSWAATSMQCLKKGAYFRPPRPSRCWARWRGDRLSESAA